jgi:hypothetical protein
VGTIVGVAVAIVAGIAALFFVRWLFVRRARRRAAFSGPGRTLAAPPPRTSTSKGGAYLASQPQTQTYPHTMPMPAPGATQASERDAVELAQYPPPSSALNPSAAVFPNPTPSASDPSPYAPSPYASQPEPQPGQPQGWSTHFASSTTEPGAGSSPAARQAYLAAELRAAQALLERGGKDVNTREVKARVRALEERQQSAWALGLE